MSAEVAVNAAETAAPVATAPVKTRKKKSPITPVEVVLAVLIDADSKLTPQECAARLNMEQGTFDQRLYDIRKQFRENADTRKEFADMYPKDAESADGLGEYPSFLELKDGRKGGEGNGKPAGEKMRDALRKLMAKETKVVDQV